MKAIQHVFILLIVAAVTLAVMLLIYRPDIVEDVWLWAIGLIGPIIRLSREGIKSLTNFIKDLNT